MKENTQQVQQVAKKIATANGHKPTPKPHKAVTPAHQASKQKLRFMALQRARAAAIKIEGEDLLDDPDLMDDLDLSELEDEGFDL